MEINGKTSVILFKTFFDANTAREFLQNNNNFKETEQNNFVARWYKLEDESVLSETMRIKVKKFVDKFLEQSMKNMSMNQRFVNFNQYNNNNFGNVNMMNGMQGMNMMNMNMNNQNMFNMNNMNNTNNVTTNKNNNIMNNMMNNNKVGKNEDDKNNGGKYTCRFEIQIDNDKEFQVARRLIGSKVK